MEIIYNYAHKYRNVTSLFSRTSLVLLSLLAY